MIFSVAVRDGIHTDESRWPIVVHRTIGVPSDADVDAFIKRADAILAKQQPHVVIFDNVLSGRVSAYMRQRSMDWLKANSPQLAEHCLGTGLVFRSAALRFVMSTVMLVASHPVPHKVCATLDEALTWARVQIAARHRMVG